MSRAKWMTGNYGIGVHYLSHLHHPDGTKKDFNEMAKEFDVESFVDEMEKMGAKWVLFPFGQNSGYYWSENPYIEKYMPNRCSKRDLVYDIAVALQKKDIRLIAYIPTEFDEQPEEMRNAFDWDKSLDKKDFMEKWMKVISYYGEKFGSLISGWWYDGNYNSVYKSFKRTHGWDNSRFDKEKWIAATKAGNPERVFAMCNGANHMSYVMEEEEYLAGELSEGLTKFPWDVDYNYCNPDLQKQWHAFITTDCFWMWNYEEKPEGIPLPRFKDAEIFNYAEKCLDKGGAITFNIGIYGDGSLAQPTVEQIIRTKNYLKR